MSFVFKMKRQQFPVKLVFDTGTLSSDQKHIYLVFRSKKYTSSWIFLTNDVTFHYRDENEFYFVLKEYK